MFNTNNLDFHIYFSGRYDGHCRLLALFLWTSDVQERFLKLIFIGFPTNEIIDISEMPYIIPLIFSKDLKNLCQELIFHSSKICHYLLNIHQFYKATGADLAKS